MSGHPDPNRLGFALKECEARQRLGSFDYIEQMLAPTLKKRDIVLMDNVSTHLVDGIEEAIEACGARVFYLPPTAQTSIQSNNFLPG
jgi:hypothetical protein